MYSSRWIGGITFLGPNLLSRSNSYCIVLHQARHCVNYVKQGNDHLFSYSLTHRAPLSSLQPYTTCRFVSDLHIIGKNISGEDNALCSYQEGRYICLLTTTVRRNRILKHRNQRQKSISFSDIVGKQKCAKVFVLAAEHLQGRDGNCFLSPTAIGGLFMF